MLTCSFLCRQCNSQFGSDLDHAAKRDPAIRFAAARALAGDADLANKIEQRQIWSVETSMASLRGEMRGAEIRGRWTELDDGSRVAPEEQALIALRGMLAADGDDERFIADALKRYEKADYDELLELSPAIAVRKLAAHRGGRDLSAPEVSSILPLKIAYEFVALIIGTAICGDDPRIEELRRALLDRTDNAEAFEIERLEVVEKAPSPLHGIWFEGNKPHTMIQIRLFGKRAYRVHLKRLAVQHPQVRYTHLILDGEDVFHQVGEGTPRHRAVSQIRTNARE